MDAAVIMALLPVGYLKSRNKYPQIGSKFELRQAQENFAKRRADAGALHKTVIVQVELTDLASYGAETHRHDIYRDTVRCWHFSKSTGDFENGRWS